MSQEQHGRNGTTVTSNDRGPKGTIVRPGARGGNGTFVVPIQTSAMPDDFDPLDYAKTTVKPTYHRSTPSTDEQGRRLETLLAFAAGSIVTAVFLLVLLLAMQR